MDLYLAPWVWDTRVPGDPHWTTPGVRAQCLGALDVRTYAQAAQAGGAPGDGIFAYTRSQTIVGALELGDVDTVLPTLTRDTLETRFLLARRPNGTVRDFLWQLYTEESRVERDVRPGPLLPDRLLQLQLVLANTVIQSEQFDWDTHPHKGAIQTDLQEAYRRNREADLARGSDHYKRQLSWWSRKYSVDYQEFIPSGLPDEGTLPIGTSFGDSFNRADNTDLNASNAGKTKDGGSGTWSWTEVAGNIGITSNECDPLTTTSAYGRVEDDMAGDDHKTELVCTTLDKSGSNYKQFAAVTRFSASANDNYFWMGQARSTGHAEDIHRLRKTTAGSRSDIGSDIADDTATGVKLTCEIDGSTLKGYLDDVEKDSQTDTSFSGQTRGGLFMFAQTTPSHVGVDDYSSEDLAAGGAGRVYHRTALLMGAGRV